MKRLGPPPVTEAVMIVIGTHGAEYRCADISAVDQHLRDLCARIDEAGTTFPSLIESSRADIDLLLDRRCWLQMLPETVKPAARGTCPA